MDGCLPKPPDLQRFYAAFARVTRVAECGRSIEDAANDDDLAIAKRRDGGLSSGTQDRSVVPRAAREPWTSEPHRWGE